MLLPPPLRVDRRSRWTPPNLLIQTSGQPRGDLRPLGDAVVLFLRIAPRAQEWNETAPLGAGERWETRQFQDGRRHIDRLDDPVNPPRPREARDKGI